MQEIVSTYKYLNFSSFSETVFWDYYTLSNKKLINSKYPLVKLNEVLIHRKGHITIDDTKIYKRCRVQIQGRGVVLRDEVIGKEIKTKKQQLCKANDFLVAEIDAKVGGYGIVPSNLETAIVSGHYFLYQIRKEKLLPEFLGLVVKQNEFSKQVKSTGSTNYSAIRPYHVLEYQIPLPSLKEQKQIIDTYNHKIQEAQGLKKQANHLEEQIENYLFEELGIELNRKTRSNSFISEIEFQTLERWSVDFIKQNITASFIIDGKYKPVKLKYIISKYQYGLSEKASKENIGVPMLRMNNIYKSNLVIDNLKYIPKTAEINKYLLKKGDLLFNRTNSKELVGKTAIFDLDEEFTFASYLIRVQLKPEIADYNFINYLFNSPILQFQKDLVSRQITGQANINAQEMQEFLFPLPPIKKQKEIVSSILSMKNNISANNLKSSRFIAEAEAEFEKQIFN